MRPVSSRLAGLVAPALVVAVLSACGGAAAPTADASSTPEPAPPEVTKADFEALSTRVLELELQVKNLQAAGATGDPIAATDGTTGALRADGSVDTEAQPEWDYTDPASWGSLSGSYQACSVGTEQSPIDLSAATSVAADIANPVVDYGDTDTATIVDNGHTVEVGLEGAGTLALEGETYELRQMHVHAPSEHTIDGEHAPLEVHFVHATVDGALAVVSVLVQVGAPAQGYDPIVGALPADDALHPIDSPIALRTLLPDQLTAYRYSGSLTTPPCTEGVTWLVLTTPLTMSQAQIDAIVSHLPSPNNRPTQDLAGRVVGLDVTP